MNKVVEYRYEGWTNRETWNVNLWIDNTYELYIDKMQFIKSSEELTAESVESFCRYMFPEGTTDIGAAGMNNVNWQELADSWITEAKEYSDKE